MSDQSQDSDPALLQALSAVADGEATQRELDAVLAAWAHDPALRQQWALNHLLGDALRSEDLLAGGHVLPGGEGALLPRLRQQLQQEPRVLAPAAAAQLAGQALLEDQRGRTPWAGRWRWMSPAAVAAGFVGMSAVLLLGREPEPTWQASNGPAPVTMGAQPMERSGTAAVSGVLVGAPPQAFSSGLPVRAELPPVLWGAEALPLAVATTAGSHAKPVPASAPSSARASSPASSP